MNINNSCSLFPILVLPNLPISPWIHCHCHHSHHHHRCRLAAQITGLKMKKKRNKFVCTLRWPVCNQDPIPAWFLLNFSWQAWSQPAIEEWKLPLFFVGWHKIPLASVPFDRQMEWKTLLHTLAERKRARFSVWWEMMNKLLCADQNGSKVRPLPHINNDNG